MPNLMLLVGPHVHHSHSQPGTGECSRGDWSLIQEQRHMQQTLKEVTAPFCALFLALCYTSQVSEFQ